MIAHIVFKHLAEKEHFYKDKYLEGDTCTIMKDAEGLLYLKVENSRQGKSADRVISLHEDDKVYLMNDHGDTVDHLR